MKRTNLVLDEQLLEEAVRALGVKTYSAAVNLALGKTVWEGDLSEMREDQPPQSAPRATRGRK
jgi:Arc/MetJ family transcription regulator